MRDSLALPLLAGLEVICDMKSMGTGKMMVEFFSAAMELRV